MLSLDFWFLSGKCSDCLGLLFFIPDGGFNFKLPGCFVSAYISTGQIMGWGNKAIEIRAAETGHLDGVFMHKKAQKLKFLCERNDKVGHRFPVCRTTSLFRV